MRDCEEIFKSTATQPKSDTLIINEPNWIKSCFLQYITFKSLELVREKNKAFYPNSSITNHVTFINKKAPSINETML